MSTILFSLGENSKMLFNYVVALFLAINDDGDTLLINDEGDELIL